MTEFDPIREIKVGMNFGDDVIPVGRLAIHERRIYFEYHAAFVQNGMEISPLQLRLASGVTGFDPHLFEGLPGVFNDSLPDGWGRLLFDRFARSRGIMLHGISPLDRLALVGKHGLGALVYEPVRRMDMAEYELDLDILAGETQEILEGRAEDVLQTVLALNGSSAGARPKALIGVNQSRRNIIHGAADLPDEYDHWLVKFPNTQDGIDAGAIEYVYALMAKRAGIEMSDVHLFPAKIGPGYFSTRRFDRRAGRRFHMHTACGLLHSDFRMPSLDYEDLVVLTRELTRDVREVERLYRLAVFNVLAHNRDDHSKNFSYLMDERGDWILSPAYDLTYSSGPQSEQSTMVMGEGRNPTAGHLRKLGLEASISKARVETIIDETRAALSQWPTLAKRHGIPRSSIDRILDRIASR